MFFRSQEHPTPEIHPKESLLRQIGLSKGNIKGFYVIMIGGCWVGMSVILIKRNDVIRY